MTIDEARPYAPVLERMVELLGAKGFEKTMFGEALERASRETRIVVPEDMKGPLLMGAFEVIANGRFRGAPDA